jgi:hypothetical protein
VKPCPECGAAGTVVLRPVIVAKPLGTFSLAGAQMKVSAWRGWELACSACSFRVLGQVEGLETDENDQITAGHFVVSPPPG